jgi:L,D-transpeptidase YcbB
VNIPEYTLTALDEQYSPSLSMRVVVGGAFDKQTPILASELRSIVLRPPWGVPASIQKEELLPRIQKNPAYLHRNDYQVVDKKGNVVTEGRVTRNVLKGLRSGDLSLRQKPGERNALGPIKFEFPNQYSVYLHGTPATGAFNRERRDLSHGCIRVEDPVRLASWVLRDNREWDAEKIREAAEGEKTIRIATPPVPILILYMTASVTPDGVVQFFQDIYGHDTALQTSIDARHPLNASAMSFVQSNR